MRVKAADAIFDKRAELCTMLDMLKEDQSISSDMKNKNSRNSEAPVVFSAVAVQFECDTKAVCLVGLLLYRTPSSRHFC